MAHARLEHGLRGIVDGSVIGNTCMFCSSYFANNRSAIAHVRNSLFGSRICNIDRARYDWPTDVPQDLKCPWCGKSYELLRALQLHVQRHLRIKPLYVSFPPPEESGDGITASTTHSHKEARRHKSPNQEQEPSGKSHSDSARLYRAEVSSQAAIQGERAQKGAAQEKSAEGGRKGEQCKKGQGEVHKRTRSSSCSSSNFSESRSRIGSVSALWTLHG